MLGDLSEGWCRWSSYFSDLFAMVLVKLQVDGRKYLFREAAIWQNRITGLPAVSRYFGTLVLADYLMVDRRAPNPR